MRCERSVNFTYVEEVDLVWKNRVDRSSFLDENKKNRAGQD